MTVRPWTAACASSRASARREGRRERSRERVRSLTVSKGLPVVRSTIEPVLSRLTCQFTICERVAMG